MPSTKKMQAALKNYLAQGSVNEAGEHRFMCAFHEDTRPSASINFEKGVWHCLACDIGGTVAELVTKIEKGKVLHRGRADGKIIKFTKTKKFKGDVEPISIGAVEGWHSALMSDANHLSEIMELRGLSIEILEKFLIGYDRQHKAFTIPVFEDGHIMNVRRYKPRATKKQIKIWSITGMGSARLFPFQLLEESDCIIIAAGEMDALIATQYGFPAITGTAGESTWLKKWGPLFKGKKVYVVYDNDTVGKKSRRKVAANVSQYTQEVFLVDLGIDEKGSDITDFFVTYGYTAGDFQTRLDEAKYFKEPKEEITSVSNATEIDLVGSFDARLSGTPLSMTVTIIGKKNPPFSIPRLVDYSCTMDAGLEKCAMCPMVGYDGAHVEEISTYDPRLLKMIDVPDKQKLGVMRGIVGIPECSKVTIEAKELQAVEDLYVIGNIDQDASSAYTERRILNVGHHETQPNTTAKVTGTLLPNPKNQQSEFLAWELESTESSIDKFKMTKEIIRDLSVFRVDDGQRPLDKLAHIARDLSNNVTKIYGRDDMHMAMDLVFHSVLGFELLGQDITKGWLELLVVGDTRTGKSEAGERLQHHYRLGTTVSCESASFAGIFGGLSQRASTNEWSIRWGAIPINDRRLVVLDEVSGLKPEEISQLSSVRSSGIAQLTKINAQQTSARTRLIWISNPRKGKLGDYSYGLKVLKPLIGNPEDIARFDFAMSVAADEVDSAVINSLHREKVKHTYSSDLCHELLLWVWSRKPENIKWSRGAEEEILKLSIKLGEMYMEDPPLVQSANVRTKIARIAVALAARTFSTDVTGENIIVKIAHVRDAVKFIDSLYKKESFGYYAVSAELRNDRRIAEKSKQEVSKYIQTHKGLVRFIRQHNSFRLIDMTEMLNIQKDEAQEIIEVLHSKRMVTKRQAQITVLPTLNTIVRKLK